MIYLTNGNMPLNAAYADEIVQEDNSTYQLTFRFPTSDSLWEQLKEETFLTADDLHGEQDFVIFEVEKKHGYIQVYANQVFTLLNNYVVSSLVLDRATGSTALSRFAGSITRDNPFSFFSDIEDRYTFNIGSKNAMEAFAKDKHSIVGQWGGDLVRHGYQVRLLKNGGSENESLFMYKKNLSSYQHKTSTKSLKTRITFTTTVKGEGEKAPDRTFTVTIDSPLINKYSQIYEDVIEVNDQDVKDEASLRKYGEQYYRTSLCDMMEDSLEIEVVGQSDVPVQMFDVVSIFHERYNLDVRKKITKYTYSPMAKKLKSIGFGQFQSGLANAIGNAVSDAVKGEVQQLQDDFERQLARELKNADLTFDRQKEELANQFTDGLNAAKARAEEVKRELSDTINQRFNSFDNGPLQEAKRRAEEALRNAGASSLLAQEAKRIGLDSVAKLEEFKRQATSAQTALSGDLDALKRTVASEVNQASEYRRTTTEVLSRMTGQMNGFATKSEVAQGIDGLTQTFAKMRVGGANLLKGSKGPFMPDRKPANFDNNILYVGNTSIYMEQGQKYIISAKTDGNFTAHHDGVKESDNVVLWIMDKNIRNYQIVSDLNTGTTGTKIIWNKPTGIYHLRVNTYHKEAVKSVWDVKIEKGNVATDWSPAFEDTDGLIIEAKATFEQTAQGLRTDLSAIQEYVNRDGQRKEALQRYTREESAKQATAVRELVARDYVGKATYQEDVRGIERRFSAISTQTNNDIATKIAQYKQTVDGQFANITSQIANKANQTDFQRVQETSKLYERILGSNENDISNKVARMALTNQLFQIEVSKNEGLKTVQRQIAGSWAVQNINSEGDLISGINLGANGYNRFDGKLTHITGETLIDNAVIKSAMVDKLKTANFEAGSVTTVVLDAEAVTAEKLKVDQAFFNKFFANEAYLSQLFAKQAFINRVQSISINASQVKAGFLSGDRILGGTITGSNIFGGTLTGHTQIQLGTYGSFDVVNGGIQINVPREPDVKDGLGVQFIGSYGRGENVPYGLFIYKDTDFTKGGTAETSDDFLLTVEGYIQTKGIGWLKTGKGSVNGKTTGTIGFWNSNNVSLAFGGPDNDIYYSYNGTAYSLWALVDKHFSDRRLKDNIVDCKHNALDYIQQFQFKEYDWKKQEDRPQKAHTKIGLIAQEVQAVDPTLVYENGDTLNLDNLRLTNIALKAIQELSQRIETLERKLA
ncbi:tail fiber domain-containing protein [Streptococcus sp. LPB0406]|nr:tail fiber domain-containing protein [Streptococcus sp. LPB0406]MBZ1354069.1 tail fiber domain-containing protein [Streptococcus sp. LPB0406]